MHYAALGHRTNNIMRVLTVITAIFLPLNLITGFFGMNFDALPLVHSASGFWVAFGLMAAVGIGLAVFFRRKRYLALYVSARNRGAIDLYHRTGFTKWRTRRSFMAGWILRQRVWLLMRKDLGM